MTNIVSISDLVAADVEAIWLLSSAPDQPLAGTVGWSFEGNGIRTRTTFVQAFRDLGLEFTELPNFLKTEERVEDLAGYLDPFYSHYVIRESDHSRLLAFAQASSRPVINAMSGVGHPCEVLTDAYFIHASVKPISSATICLWGPTTNVFRSWHELATVMGAQVIQVCDERYHEVDSVIRFDTQPAGPVDVVITDSWPKASGVPTSLTEDHLAAMGFPALLPTPPYSIGRELNFDPLRYQRFLGYSQKQWLVPVQKAIIRYASQVQIPKMPWESI